MREVGVDSEAADIWWSAATSIKSKKTYPGTMRMGASVPGRGAIVSVGFHKFVGLISLNTGGAAVTCRCLPLC